MKKKFLFILCLLTTVTASAVNGLDAVHFCGTYRYLFNETSWTWDLSTLDVDDDWESTSGTATWDGSTRTLTLNNIYISRYQSPFSHAKKDGIVIECYTGGEVNVVVKGKCTVFPCSGSALYAAGNVTFTGNGTLYLGGSEADIRMGWSNTVLTVDGPAITLAGISSEAQLLGSSDKTCSLRMESGSVKFEKAASGTPDAANAYPIQYFASVSKPDNIDFKTPHGAFFNPFSGLLHDVDGNEVKGQEAYIGKVETYGVRIMGIMINEANHDVLSKRLSNSLHNIWGSKGSSTYSIHFSPSDNTLTFCDVTLLNVTKYHTIENLSNDNLCLLFLGPNSFRLKDNGYKRYFLRALANTKITTLHWTRDCSVLSDGPESTGGIFMAGGEKLSIVTGSEKLDVNVPYIEGGNSSAELYINKYVSLTATGHSKGTIRNIRFTKKVPLLSSESSHKRFIWNRTDGIPGVYESQSKIATGPVYIYKEENVTKYNVKIGDEYIHEHNKDYFISDIVKDGYIAYSTQLKRLYLHNVTIEASDNELTDIISLQENGVKIQLDGTNKIKCLGSTPKTAINAAALEQLLIEPIYDQSGTGSGSLTVTSSAVDGGGIYTKGKCSVNGCNLSAPNLTAASLDIKDCTVNITHELKNYNDGTLIVPATINNTVVASTPEAPAYYDNETKKVVSRNGAVNFVPQSSITVYPFTFCGQEVNSANAEYLINKYMKGNEGYAQVTKKSDRYNIQLNGLDVNYNGSLPVFDFTDTPHEIYLQLVGKNNFNLANAGNDALFIKGNGYINIEASQGNKALTVAGKQDANTGAIAVNSNLYISKNPDIRVPRIYGTGSSSKLYIYTPYLTVTGNSQGTVKDIKCILEGDVELYNTSSSPREIKNDGVYENGALCTGEVKFVGKGESYIPVEDIVLDKRKVTLTKKGQQVQLSATVLPEDATDKSFTWNNWGLGEDVATVDANGVVTALSNGTTTVYACPAGTGQPWDWYATGEHHSSCYIIVDIPEATGITLDRTEYTFQSESVSAIFVRATLTPDNADYDEIEWTSSDESIAYVVGSGKGREAQIRRTDKDGTCTITAKIGSLTTTCQITTRLHPTYVEEITFDVPDEVHLKRIGESFTITPTILPANATDKTIEWYSNTKDNVVVDQNGKVTAKNYGGSVVFAFAKDGSDVYKSIRVYVDRPPVLATGIEIEPQFPRTFYAIGDQLALTATITPANATNKEVLWKSDNESVATVSEGGLVTITGWGSCYVTATTTDGTNLTSDPCYIDAEDPANIWEPVPGTGLSLDQKEVTIIKGQETSVLINMTPANCNYQPNCWNLEEWEVFQPIIGDFRVEEDYEKHTYSLMVRSYPDDMGGQSGTAHIVVCLPDHALDKDKLREMGYPEDYVPTDTLTVHVIDPIYFTAKSAEGIDVTYHVPSLERDECEVYADLDEQNWDIELQDFVTTPAVPVTSAGKLTVPSKATDSSTGKEYWVTSVGRSAFTLCSKLTEIEFSEGIRSIGDNACYRRLYALEKVTLPSSIEELNQFCFAAHPMDYAEDYNYIQRSNLREVYIKSFLPPTGPYMPFDENSGYYTPIEDTQAFFGIAEGAVLYVPTGAKENYNHYPWISSWVEDESWEEGGYEMEGWFSRIEEMDFFLDEDGIRSPQTDNDQWSMVNEWYDLSGRKLDGKPTTPGLYIRGNKKIVVR